jgi:two-component system, OmpR family, alkaline phosphatase synthesis response regulator PhoP
MTTKDKKKILLAEDDKFICRAYSDGFERAGFAVTVVNDGDAVIGSLEKDKPDIIMLDIIMPSKNGFEVLGDIKMSNDFKKIPVIILSNLGQETDVDKGKELGAVDYLVKSNTSMKEVVEKIKFHLAKQ